LELNQVDKAYAYFSANPRLALTQETKVHLAEALEKNESYQKMRDVYMSIDDCSLRLLGAKVLISEERGDLVGTYITDLEKICPDAAEEIRRLLLEFSVSQGDSLTSLETGLGISDMAGITAVEALTLGDLFNAFSLYEDAIGFYNVALDRRRYDAALPMAECYAALGENRDAAKTFEAAKALSFSPSHRATRARVRLLSGEDFEAGALEEASFRNYSEYVRGMENLAEANEYVLYEMFLFSNRFSRASQMLRKARFLEFQGRSEEALVAYEDFLADAPFASERGEAAREAELIRNFKIKDPEAALKKFLNASTSSEKGRILFEDAKDYEGAIQFLDTVQTPLAFYYSGLAYERLYNRDGKIKHLDRARERYQNLYWQFPEDTLIEEALYRLFVTEVRDPLKKVDQAHYYLREHLEGNIKGKYADEIGFLMGYVELSRGDTAAARNGWEILYSSGDRSRYTYPALYELARLSLAQGDTSDAAVKYKLICSVASEDTLYFRAMRELALLEKGRGRGEEALELYKKMVSGLPAVPTDIWEEVLDLIFELERYSELDYFAGLIEDKEYLEDIRFYRYVAKVQCEDVGAEDIQGFLHSRPADRKDEFLYWSGVGARLAGYESLGLHQLERLSAEGRDSVLVANADFIIAQMKIQAVGDTAAMGSALETLWKLHEQNPDDTLIMAQLVTALYRAGKFAQADSLWYRLDLRSGGDQSPLLLEKVAHLLTEGRTEEADSVLDELSDVRSLWMNDQFVYYKGLSAARQGLEDEAVQTLKGLVSNFPGSEFRGQAYMKLGVLYHLQEEYDSASRYYRLVLEYPDLRNDALLNMAKMEKTRSQFDKALEYFELLAQEATSSEDRGRWYLEMGVTSYHAAGYYRSISYLERSIVFLERALPLVTEQRPYLLYSTGRTYAAFLDDEHLERAVSVFLQCHEEYPQNQWGLECWFQAGVGYTELGRPEDAKVIFKAIINARGPDDAFGIRAQEALDKLE
ncbi:tetratricopeptide repeat protein, partial [candidate division WOR-3 bacterium]|nr:tetratricopeptide repeat protein [candidate division WOR-3 bacterium]MBD3365661.1 tetratricopeptide repeat protein [candidate division WOR-3 bacterium]